VEKDLVLPFPGFEGYGLISAASKVGYGYTSAFNTALTPYNAARRRPENHYFGPAGQNSRRNLNKSANIKSGKVFVP